MKEVGKKEGVVAAAATRLESRRSIEERTCLIGGHIERDMLVGVAGG